MPLNETPHENFLRTPLVSTLLFNSCLPQLPFSQRLSAPSRTVWIYPPRSNWIFAQMETISRYWRCTTAKLKVNWNICKINSIKQNIVY